MKDQKNTPQEESQNNKLRKITKKRWFYPALYLVVVALIVSAVLWTQRDGGTPSADKHKENDNQFALNQNKDDSVPVNGMKEVFKWPVADKNATEVVMPFYDVNASPEEQQKALVTYNNTTTQNTGICIAAKDGKTFDVQASMSGKVVKAEKDPVLGNVVVLQHDNGVETMYESLDEMKVEKGEQVSQGQVLGTAGKDLYNKEAGIHVHFEIRKNDKPVNPVSYFQKGLASLDKVKSNTSSAEVTNGQPSANDQGTEQQQDNKDNKDNSMNNDKSNSNSKTSTDQSGDNATQDENSDANS
ncbi:stage II sporulation protein Q [Pullulanibacillus camelliae]|uniref:Stage II sporulation protein Q n=1 Tax=Pullulanibacillus camelliae TaxID=1707096 RepID=A0A8J2VM75_9BACL|nr:M23 family metallopeptidase [Pullulanibacillus camelliae]GGE28353.1 stage II sporulation protein Q [Pullulanibacillus camelliae]